MVKCQEAPVCTYVCTLCILYVHTHYIMHMPRIYLSYAYVCLRMIGAHGQVKSDIPNVSFLTGDNKRSSMLVLFIASKREGLEWELVIRLHRLITSVERNVDAEECVPVAITEKKRSFSTGFQTVLQPPCFQEEMGLAHHLSFLRIEICTYRLRGAIKISASNYAVEVQI